jgi:hypothetical protein
LEPIMRAALAILALGFSAAPALAADTAAVDLVARFILGADDGATVVLNGGMSVGKLLRSSPGNFSATPSGGGSFAFAVTEKSHCVFDILFNAGGVPGGGIELDASKLQLVTYDLVKQNDGWTDYRITLHGQPNVLQEVGPKGQLGPIQPTSQLSTSLSAKAMQAAVTELQKSYCPAAA